MCVWGGGGGFSTARQQNLKKEGTEMGERGFLNFDIGQGSGFDPSTKEAEARGISVSSRLASSTE